MNKIRKDIPFRIIPSKKENKKYILMFGLLAFLITTVFALIAALKNEDLGFKLPLVVLVLIGFGVFYGNYYGKMKKIEEKGKQVEEDSWEREEKKVGTSKFNNPLEENFDISFFSLGLIVFLSYFSIYLSELLNVTIKFNKSYPDVSFGTIFKNEIVNILTKPYSEYVYKYWKILTVFIVIGAALIFGIMYLQKKERNKK